MNKADIIFWVVMMIILGGILFGISNSIKNSRNEYNICSEVYGYEQLSYWNWEGSNNLNYVPKYFNETHIACCKKVKFIDHSGQIQSRNCTGVYSR